MEFSQQVTLVSAFGRGHWLAAALAKEGLKVTLIDVSSDLGVWPSEDVEGPFGFFRNDRVTPLQIEHIFSEGPFEEVDSGFTMMLKEGPLEFKSPLTGFYFNRQKWSQAVFNLMAPGSSNEVSQHPQVYAGIKSKKFSDHWAVHFSHQWASTTYLPSARAAGSGKALSLLSSFFVRNATRMGLEKSLSWLQEKNVEVLKQSEIKDISFGPGKTITGLELLGEKRGLFKTDQLVWMLTSEESFYINDKLAKHLYNQGALEPEWCWLRYRVKLAECAERNSLPLHMVHLRDLYSPWTHENMLVLQRTALPDQFDAWMHIPNVQRFNKEYLTNRGSALVEQLGEKISTSDPQIQNFPQEYYYTYGQLGPSRFPVFAESSALQRGGVGFGNLYLDGPEVWSQYSWNVMFEKQEIIRAEIANRWKLGLQRYQKLQARKGTQS